MLGSAFQAAGEHAANMHLRSLSFLVAAVGCLFFVFGGFMLLPVALDIWELGEGRRATAA
jgi:hypothetical protein